MLDMYFKILIQADVDNLINNIYKRQGKHTFKLIKMYSCNLQIHSTSTQYV